MRFSGAVLASVLAVLGLLGVVGPLLADGASLDGSEQDLVARINSFRASRGLPTLAVSDTLSAAAKWMSFDMGARNYFAHTSLDGRSPTQRMYDAGYPAFGTWTGEDLAAGYTTTADVLNGWINSPAHYAVLVNPRYHAIGVGHGYTTGSTYGWYWTADFGGVVDVVRAAPAARAVTTASVQSHYATPALVALPPDSGYHASWSAQSPDPVVAAGERTTPCGGAHEHRITWLVQGSRRSAGQSRHERTARCRTSRPGGRLALSESADLDDHRLCGSGRGGLVRVHASGPDHRR